MKAWIKTNSLLLGTILLSGCALPFMNGQEPMLFETPPIITPTPANPIPPAAGSLWAGNSDSWSLFGDDKAMRPGDLVTVNIIDIGEGESNTGSAVKRDSSLLAGISNFFGLESEFGAGANASGRAEDVQLDKVISAKSALSFAGEGELKRDHKLIAKISAVVIDTLPNGTLKIHGYKVTTIGREQNYITVQGLVRPSDLDQANTIDSTKIANATIEYGIHGPNTGDIQQMGWAMRGFSRLWPF